MSEPTIGELLRRYRKAADLTQHEIAIHIPCNSATISRIENGDLFPQVDYIRAFIAIQALALTEEQRQELVQVFFAESGRQGLTGQPPAPSAAPVANSDIEGQAPSLSELRQRYLEFIIDTYNNLIFHGMGVTDADNSLPLLEVYVPLRAHAKLPSAETWLRSPPQFARSIPADQLRFGGRPLSGMEVQALGDQMSIPLPALELLKQQEGLVLLGDPGSGKSTFIKWLALNLAMAASQRQTGESPGRSADASAGSEGAPATPPHELGLDQRLPIVIPMRAYAAELAQRDAALGDFLADYYHRQLGINLRLGALFDSALKEGQALVMLDGLDEVTDLSLRITVVDRVRKFFNWHRRAGNKFVLTSRIVGFREAPLAAPGLLQCTLSDFNSNDIEDFVRRWYEAVMRQSPYDADKMLGVARQREMDLLADIGRHTRVRELAANPLLLTIMALMKRQGLELVKHRVELFDNYIRTLLKYWNLARSLDQRPTWIMDDREVERVLAQLALWIQQTNPERGIVNQEQVLRKLIEIYTRRGTPNPEEAAYVLLRGARDHSGLLVEIGPGEFGFVHLTFLEYLAASAIAQIAQTDLKAAIDIVAPHLLEPAWREVILLTVSGIGIVRRADELASELLRRLLQLPIEQPGQLAELLGEAAADAWPGGITHDCQIALSQALVATLQQTQQVPARVRISAGNALGRLGDPRPQVMRVEEMPFCYIPGGAFDMGGDESNQYEKDDLIHVNTSLMHGYWLGQFPVTNAQYQAFVASGGYRRADYWQEAEALGMWHDGQVTHGSYRWDTEAQEFVRSMREWADGPRRYIVPFMHPNHPVNNVTWYEALAYTRWVTEVFDLRQAGWEASLPSEAEWEKAARGGQEKRNWQQSEGNAYERPDEAERNGWLLRRLSQNWSGLSAEPSAALASASTRAIISPTPVNLRRFPWGNQADPNRCNYAQTGARTTNTIGVFPNGASPYGCMEMIGNVWEWTRSLWGYRNYEKLFLYPYRPDDGREDLLAPPEMLRCIRGGSWYSQDIHARCAYARRNTADYLNENIGFRIVIVPYSGGPDASANANTTDAV